MTAEQRHNVSQQALQAFLGDLPQLYHERPGQWVAYRGRQLLGFAEVKHELYQECFRQGLQSEDFVVFCIEAQETEMWLGPMFAD